MDPSNDSQVTLINPDFEREPALVLMLSKDNIKETVMRRKGGTNEVMYNIQSDSSMTRTSISRPTSNVPIAVLELKGIFGKDTITFTGEEKKRIRDWLSGYSPLRTLPISFDHNGKRYFWRANFINQLGLFSEQDDVHPIAWFAPFRLRFIDGALKGFKAHLAMEEEAAEMRDLVVVSFLIVENKVRKDMRPGTLEGGVSMLSRKK